MSDFIKDNKLEPFDCTTGQAVHPFLLTAWFAQLHNKVPPGWHKLLDLATAASNLLGGNIMRVTREKGLLRITTTAESVTATDLLRRINDTIARDSARVCMVCGASGYRRKQEEGMPALCRDHYITYVNALDDAQRQS